MHPFLQKTYTFLFNHKAWKQREQHRSFGSENPDKIFYVIRFDDYRFGLLTLWKFAASHVRYCEEHGYIPVVDLKNYYAEMIQNKGRKKLENAWEYYFEQPQNEWSLEEVYRSKHVILGYRNYKADLGLTVMDMPMEKELYQRWFHYLSVLPLKREIAEQGEEIRKRLFPLDERILGASARFEYNALSTKGNSLIHGHAVQPSVQEFAQLIRKRLKEWNCTKVFISVDDKDARNFLMNEFGTQAIVLERQLPSFYHEGKAKANQYYRKEINAGMDVKQKSMDYLMEVWLLSNCDCLLAGKTSGNSFAYLLNNHHYEQIEIFDRGVY